MEHLELIDLFIKNFVQKEKRERADHELKNEHKRIRFKGKLNHQWDTVLDMRYISKIPNSESDYDYAIRELKMKDNEKCYVISIYDDLDGQIMAFETAFDKSYGRGLATLIMNLNGDKLYLETEIGYGKQNRFIGKR